MRSFYLYQRKSRGETFYVEIVDPVTHLCRPAVSTHKKTFEEDQSEATKML